MEQMNIKIWEFIRGDLTTNEFETYIYKTTELQNYLGEELYFETISNDYRNNDSTYMLKKKLAEYQKKRYPTGCNCIELNNLSAVNMGEESNEVLKTIYEVVPRGQPYWWLYIGECTNCHQFWLIAQEEKYNDIFCLQRLNDEEAKNIIEQNEWPKIFDNYDDLPRIEMEARRRV